MASMTIVIPVFNEGRVIFNNIKKLRARLDEDGLDADILLVDDGSRDDSWERMREICRWDKRALCLRLSRNFGKEAAIFAGISQVKSERCLVMDSDLQHPPSAIIELVREMDRSGADIVEGIKHSRGREFFLKRWTAGLFYSIFTSLSGYDMRNSSDFKLMGRKVIDTLGAYRENGLFFRGLIDWSGFSKVQVPFDVEKRSDGVSKFGVLKLVGLAVGSTLSYTSKPLYVTVLMGLIFLFGALVLAVQTLANFFLGHSVSGFTTLILLVLIIGSLILLTLGIIGAYIARIYEEVKGRPQYIIREKYGKPDAEV